MAMDAEEVVLSTPLLTCCDSRGWRAHEQLGGSPSCLHVKERTE